MAPTVCENINHKLAADGPFLNEAVSSWKAICKFYSGDSNCLPHPDIYKRTFKYSNLLRENKDEAIQAMSLPGIGGETVNKENWEQVLQICQTTGSDKISSCEEINYKEITNDFGGQDNEQRVGARCTEIGYYYDLMCKSGGNDSCVTITDCVDLTMYTFSDGNLNDSLDLCGGFEGCQRDAGGCKEFSKDDNAFYFSELNNTGLSLTQIQKKCENVELVLDYPKYDLAKNNFQDHASDTVCVEATADQIPKILDEEHCTVAAALLGKRSKFDENQDPGLQCAISEEELCSTVKFSLPVKYDNDNLSSDGDDKINVNPVYENSLDFGEYLCDKVGCDGERNGDTYTCFDITTTTTTTSSTNGVFKLFQFGITLLAVVLI